MFKCKRCGRITTDEEHLDEKTNGSGGWCFCERLGGNPMPTEMVQVKWWEMLDWNHMETAWNNLSEKIKNDIRAEGLAPDHDLHSLRKTAKVEVEQ